MNELLAPLFSIAGEIRKISYDLRNEVGGMPTPEEPPKPDLGGVERIYGPISSHPEGFSTNVLFAKFHDIAADAQSGAQKFIETGYPRFVEIGNRVRELANMLERSTVKAELAVARQVLETITSELPMAKQELDAVRAAMTDAKTELSELLTEQREQHVKIAEQVQKTGVTAANLGIIVQEASSMAQEGLKEVKQAHIAQIEALKEVDTKIAGLLSEGASKYIATDFKNSAANEKKAADNLRLGALACMAVIALLLGYSIYETIDAAIVWPQILGRIALVFLLSVPAAYMARESAKHREQQYHHHQTGLDLTAIVPFIAEMPPDEQYKIKGAIAAKLFAGRDFSKTGSDPFPINSHELLIKLIDKFDFSKVDKDQIKPN